MPGPMFLIEDEMHGEQEGPFQSRELAMGELERRAGIPWNEDPNRTPCTSWRTCRRRYQLIEFDDSAAKWQELSRAPALEISAAGVRWLTEERDKS